MVHEQREDCWTFSQNVRVDYLLVQFGWGGGGRPSITQGLLLTMHSEILYDVQRTMCGARN